MSDHGTALKVTPGIQREFHSAVIGQLPNLTDEEMQWHNRHKGKLGRLLQTLKRSAIEPVADKPKVRSRVIETFTITCEGQKVSELVRLGGYDWVNDGITDVRFPIEPHAPMTRRIEFIECDYDPSSQEALEELAFHGLKRPTPEDALKFGVEHPEAQRKRFCTFLHEPVLDPHGRPAMLVLYGRAGNRSLNLDRFDYESVRHYVFAGVRE